MNSIRTSKLSVLIWLATSCLTAFVADGINGQVLTNMGQIRAVSPAQNTNKPPGQLPLLTKALEVRRLTPEQAAWKYPVRLRGVVTLCSLQHGRIYVQDDTSGAYLFVRKNASLPDMKTGDLVEVEGVSDPGGFAPIVLPTKVTVIGTGPLPEPLHPTSFQLASGQYNGLWVEAHGVVHSLSCDTGLLQLKLDDPAGTFFINIPTTSEPTNLLDAVVRIAGVCGVTHNTNRQITGSSIWSPSLDYVHIEEAAAADPLSLPEQSILSLSQFRPVGTLERRMKIAGIVTLCLPGQSFFVQDASDAIQVLPTQKSNIKAGDKVVVAGYSSLGDYSYVLRDAIFRVEGQGPIPEPKIVRKEFPLDPDLNNRWVRMDARLLNIGWIDRVQVLTLQAPGRVVEAHCFAPTKSKAPAVGSLLCLTGVYRVLAGEARSPRSFQILVPSGSDIEVLERPSWWADHYLPIIGMMVAIVLVTILWNFLLRRRVEKQTDQLRTRLEREAALEQSYREIFDGASDLIFTHDLRGRMTSLNAAGQRVLGYSMEEVKQLTIDQVIAPEYHDRARQLRETKLTSSEVATCECEFVAKDGRRIMVETSTHLTFKDGKQVGVQGIARNIADRKRAEETLRESEAKHRQLVESSPIAIFIECEGRFAFINQAGLTLFDVPRAEDILGKPVLDFVHPDDRESVTQRLAELREGKGPVPSVEKRYLRLDGSVVDVEVAATPIRFNNKPAAQVILHDISERKRAQTALSEASNLLETLLDNSPDCIYFKDHKSRFVRFSKAFAKLFNITDTSKLRGKTDFDFFTKEHAQPAYDDEQEIIRTGVPIIGKLEKETHPDGHTSWALTTKMPWRDKDGNAIGTFGISKDVTAIKEAEAKLAHERELFQTLLRTIPDNIYFKDRESRIVRVSRSKVEGTLETVRESYRTAHPNAGPNEWPDHLASIDKFGEWLIGKTDFDTYPEAHARAAYEDEQEIMRTGKPIVGKLQKATLEDGNAIWWLSAKVPWYDEKGNIIGTFGISSNVTAIKEAEAKLTYEQELFRTLLDGFPDVIYFKDLQSRLMRFSRSKMEKTYAAVLGGYRAAHPSAGQNELPPHLTSPEKFSEWLVGKTDFDTFAEEHARPAYDDEQEIIRTGVPIIGKMEKETNLDGQTTWAMTTKMPWRDKDGTIIGTFGISKDVTAMHEAEARLAHERELFRTLLDNLPDAIYFKDRESHYTRLSRSKVEKSWEMIVKRYRAEHPSEELPPHLAIVEKFAEYLNGKTDFDVYPEARARSAYEDEQEIMRTGKPVVGRLEHTMLPDGKSDWVLTTKMPWYDENGNIIGTFGVSRNVTSLKEAEAQLEIAHKQLVETSRLAGMAEVASDVLHNVGNVLNSVNVSCSLTIDRVKSSKVASLSKVSGLLEENRGRLDKFFTVDQRGQQLPGYLAALAEHFASEQVLLLKELGQLLQHIEHIKQIVAMQQSYAKVAGVVESISPSQLVDDALHINGAALLRHDIKVRREFDEVPMIFTEKHKVLQILVNLIRNAKYALDEAKQPDRSLTIKVCNEGAEHVKIQVTDNGIGIPPENLTRIFGHGFTTRHDGHGFGLHSSALTVKELGGSLQAYSEGTGKGATFTLVLPFKLPAKH
jgi:PAS domain S-box-containing protein